MLKEKYNHKGAEDINHLIELKEKEIKEMVETEMALFKFELAQACIPKKEFEKSVKAVERYRKERWKKALKLAKGDEEKAEAIYDKVS